ncbi:MAG: hypothetical protein ACK5Z0_05905, partial [Planctomycetota bacterium]
VMVKQRVIPAALICDARRELTAPGGSRRPAQKTNSAAEELVAPRGRICFGFSPVHRAEVSLWFTSHYQMMISPC